MITSSQNPKLKLARALAGRSKERREADAFLAEGVRLVEEALSADWPIRFVLYSSGLSERGQALVEKLKNAEIEIDEVSDDLLQAASETETSQGILAVLDHAPLSIPHSLNFILIPDQIRDPGNLGTSHSHCISGGRASRTAVSRNRGCLRAQGCPCRDGGAFPVTYPCNGVGRD